MVYTNEEMKNIKEAYNLLERVFESRHEAENLLCQALKYEYRQRGNNWTARALIVRSVYERNKIQKHNLFTLSSGILDCVIVALNLFHNPSPLGKEKIDKFNKAAKKAIESHSQAITRNLDAVCAS